MAGFAKELSNVDAFLGNLKSLPSFKRAQELQVQKILDLVNKKRTNEEMVAQSSEAIQRLVNFEEDHKQQFIGALMDAFEASLNQKRNVELQDYTNMANQIPKAVWQNLLSQTIMEQRILVLCNWLSMLGLVNPTEATIGAMTVLCHWPEWSALTPTKQQMAQAHLMVKPLMKRTLKATCTAKQARGPLYLPDSFQKLPLKLRQAFGKVMLGAIKFLESFVEGGDHRCTNIYIDIDIEILVLIFSA